MEEWNNGVLGNEYVHGMGLLWQEEHTTAQQSYFHGDAQMSTRLLTTAQGAVQSPFTYEAFGTDVGLMGQAATPYRYTAQQFDSPTGLYYLRARYLVTGQGRFLASDPIRGLPELPSTLHGYAYAGGNPGNHVDPSGGSYIGAIATVAISGILVALDVYSIISGIKNISEGDIVEGTAEVALGLLGIGLLASTAKMARFVASPIALLIRSRYLQGFAHVASEIETLRKAGVAAEQIAQHAVEARNALKLAGRAEMAAKGGLGGKLAVKLLEFRNWLRYGNGVGPTAEQLLLKYGSWDAVVEASLRSSRSFNSFFGLL